MSVLQEALDACAALTRRVEHLELDKISQALEITKLKKRVKKLENRNKVRVLKLRRLKKVGTSQRIDTSDDTMMDDESNQGMMIVKIDKDDAGTEIYKIDMDHASKVLSMQDDEPAEVLEVVEVVTTAKLITEVVTAASETVTSASAIILTAEPQVPAATLTVSPARVADAPNKGKGIMVEEPKPLKKKQQIEHDKEYARKLHDDLNKDIDWNEAIDHEKRKCKEDPANVVGFKMDYFKGMSYDDIRPIFKAKFNSNVAFLLKTKEQLEEEENRALQKLNETPAQREAKKRKLDEEVEDLKRHLEIVPNEDDDVYTEATPLQEREYLEALWSLVKERFSTTKPKNFFNDFVLTTLGAMFETPDPHAQIWKNQRSLILLVERRYPLSRFTLDQMLNAVRLQVKEESEVSLELLSFGVDAAMDVKEICQVFNADSEELSAAKQS
uniref:Uncharacterized protein n=1 Tax=Tanacetum cinerariifolium TaxID=118510 RepID=A0A6L2M5F7_TANCI|nr:hypothetical protein [Tanacetum cinerariifolium]